MDDAWNDVAELVHGVLGGEGFVGGIVDGREWFAVDLQGKGEVEDHAKLAGFVGYGRDGADF